MPRARNMADKNFDKNIRELLQDTPMDYDPSSWSAMSDKLDLELGGDTPDALSESESTDQFDQLLKDKLENATQEFDQTSWGDLAEKIEKDEELRGRILRVGIIQCLVALLLLLSLWNWKGAEIVQEKKNEQLAETEMQFAFIQMHENFYQQFTTDLQLGRVSLYDLTFPVIELDKIRFRPIAIYAPSTSTSTPSPVQNTLVKGAPLMPYIQSQLDASENQYSSEYSFKASPLYDLRPSKLEIAQVNQKEVLIPIDKVLLKHEKTILIDFEPEEKEEVLVEKGITAVFSPDLYLIRSSDDPIYPLPSYFTDSYGLSGGAMFSLKSNSLEMETGLIYSSVSYRPRQITEQYSSRGQYFETSLNNIFFNVISLPFQFKWHFDLGSNSSFYALAGSSFNMIINSNFNINNTVIATPINGLADLKENKPLLEEKDFDPGIFEGGDIFDNAFLTADLGFGFQQRVAKRFSFFVQPTLSTQFSRGIGPNQDKLHRASLYLGAKYHLN